MSEPDPHLYHLNKPEKSGRVWVYGIVAFCAILLFGSVWYVLDRMPSMLCGSIMEARRVDITSTATKAPLVFTSPVHREALAKLIESRDFRFSMGDTWRAYRGDIPRDQSKETMVLEIVTSNRNSPVEILSGDLLMTGKFAFRAAKPGDLGPDVLNISKMKK
jgi:hypothetical protein